MAFSHCQSPPFPFWFTFWLIYHLPWLPWHRDRLITQHMLSFELLYWHELILSLLVWSFYYHQGQVDSVCWQLLFLIWQFLIELSLLPRRGSFHWFRIRKIALRCLRLWGVLSLTCRWILSMSQSLLEIRLRRGILGTCCLLASCLLLFRVTKVRRDICTFYGVLSFIRIGNLFRSLCFKSFFSSSTVS